LGGSASDGLGPQFVVGTGGKELYPLGPGIPDSEVRNDMSFGVLRLTLRPHSDDWEFVPAAGQKFIDAGSAPCH
jgi:hypothetical protein